MPNTKNLTFSDRPLYNGRVHDESRASAIRSASSLTDKIKLHLFQGYETLAAHCVSRETQAFEDLHQSTRNKYSVH